MTQICALVAGAGEALVLPLLATQILWINLVTDSFPALAVGVDPAEAGLMRRAPRARASSRRACGGALVRLRWSSAQARCSCSMQGCRPG